MVPLKELNTRGSESSHKVGGVVLEPNSAGDGVSEGLPVLRGEDRGSRGGGEIWSLF